MTQQKPIRASDFSGVYDPDVKEVVEMPDFERLRRWARLTPEDAGYNPNALTMAEIDQLEQQWRDRVTQQQQ